MAYVIAIDGPSGAGKSSIAKQLSQKLGITYLDTGAMYRATALFCYQNGIDVQNAEEVEKNLSKIDIDMQFDNGTTKVLLNGKDVSKQIRENHISQMASDVSKLICVRLAMVAEQREIAGDTSIVMDGREIGTFVFPNAEVKFYLDASSKVRAERRRLELIEKGEDIPVDTLQKELEIRDANDMNREFAPLKRAEDAHFIDSSTKSIQEVVEEMEKIIKETVKVEGIQ